MNKAYILRAHKWAIEHDDSFLAGVCEVALDGKASASWYAQASRKDASRMVEISQDKALEALGIAYKCRQIAKEFPDETGMDGKGKSTGDNRGVA